MDINDNNCIEKGSPRHIPQSKFPHFHCYAPGCHKLVYIRNVMLFGNMKMSGTESGMPDFETLDMDIPTDYDENMEEIEGLMARFYPEYLMEVAGGLYVVPDKTEQSLRNIFSLSAARSYFYDAIPSMANPLGLSERSVPIAAKVQNLLIGDFLNYLALRHRIFLSVMDEASKKKAMTKPSPPPES